MKLIPILISSALTLLTSQVSFAKTDLTKSETWTCTSSKTEGYVSHLQVNIDHNANTAVGLLYDGTMSNVGIEIGADASDLSKLDGAIAGHDQRFYQITLVRGTEQSIGSASVSYYGFIDCIGDVSGLETLACEIK
ncbi:MAG: hypothetical protein WA160_04925 [Pseudobdellovibrio sp.]